MVYASPVKHGAAEIIEDIMPVYNVKVALRVDEKIKRVYLGVTGEDLDFKTANGDVLFTVPKLECHASIVIEY